MLNKLQIIKVYQNTKALIEEAIGGPVSVYTIEALIKFKERLLASPNRSQAKKDQDTKDIAMLKARQALIF